jgi:tRNA pseudouridine55 synthase
MTHSILTTSDEGSFEMLNGILLLNKPPLLTSQQVVSQVKRLFKVKKAGHTGSLDPIATGLLPICLGEATKFSQFLLATDKHYRVEAQLGLCTDTGDCQGQPLTQRPIPRLERADILPILQQFTGTLFQLPPMYSAIKHQGKPLYHWARKGITLERKPRQITIHHLELLDYQSDKLILEVKCSKGTYIRSLVEDIGEALNCGAHVTALHRLSVGHYQVTQSVDLNTLESIHTLAERAHHLLPLEAALPQWPIVKVSEAAAFYFRRGQALALPKTPDTGWVRLVLKPSGPLLGIGQMLKDGRIAPYRLVNFEIS